MMKRILLFLLICVLAYPVSADMTLKSASFYPIVSDFNSLNEANVTLDIIVNSGNQIVFGELAGYNLSTPFKLSISDRTETLKYDFLNQGATYRYDSYYSDVCPGKPSYCYLISRGVFSRDKYLVVNRIEDGTYGYFGNPARSSSEIITINEIIKIIGSGDKQSAISFYDQTGDWFGNVQFVGASITGNDAPNQDNFVGTFKDGKRRVAHKASYLDYQKSFYGVDTQLSIWQQLENPTFQWDKPNQKPVYVCQDSVCSEVLNLLNLHNANLERLQAENVQIGYNSVTAGKQTIDGEGNLINTITKPIAYDELIFTLRASKIGVMIPVGKLEIVAVDIPEFVEGDGQGTGKITIRNVGVGSSNARILASGATEAQAIVGPGETKEVSIYFENVKQGEYQGEIIVYDANSGEKASQNFNLTVKEPKNLIPDKITAYNEVSFQNSHDGMNKSIIDNCDGQVMKWNGSGYECYEVSTLKTQIIPGQPGMKEQIVYPSKETPLIEYFKYGLYMLVVILLIAIVFNARGSRSKKGIWGIVLTFVVIVVLVELSYVLWPQIQDKIDEYRVLLYFI